MKHFHLGSISFLQDSPHGQILQPVPFEGATIWAFRVFPETRGRIQIDEGTAVPTNWAFKPLFVRMAGPQFEENELSPVS